MKKTLLSAALLSVSVLFANVAAADVIDYVSVSSGQAKAQFSKKTPGVETADSYSVLVGHNYSDALGVEAEYSKFSYSKASALGAKKESASVQARYSVGLPSLPFLSAYAKGGVAYSRNVFSDSKRSFGYGLVGSIGVEMAVTSTVSARIEHQQIRNMADEQHTLKNTTLGLKFNF